MRSLRLANPTFVVLALAAASCAARCPEPATPDAAAAPRGSMTSAREAASATPPVGTPPVARPAPPAMAYEAVPAAAVAGAAEADSASRMRVHLVDVGQGAATLFEFPCGAVLVDTGGETNDRFDGQAKLDAYLDRFFDGRPDLNRTLDAVFITHPHIDHTRAEGVVRGYTIKNVITDGMDTGSGVAQQRRLENWAIDSPDAEYRSIAVSEIPAGGITDYVIDPVECDGVDPSIRVLWGLVDEDFGWTQKQIDNENNHSLVIRVDYGDASVLITGDLEEEAIEALLARYDASDVLDIDVYQAGHHGSKNGTTFELIQAMSPSVSLIAMGPSSRRLDWTAWAYGHPNKDVVNLMANGTTRDRSAPKTVRVGSGARRFQQYDLTKAVYGTGWDGTVVVTAWSDGRLRVATES